MSLGEKLTTIAANMKNVYGRGYAGGYSEGQEEGFKNGYAKGMDVGVASGFEGGYQRGSQDGKAEAHQAFWEELQRGGERTNYQYGFIGMGWSFDNFYPIYDIVPIGSASCCFTNWSDEKGHKGSLKERLKLCGVRLDTSNVTNMLQFFANGEITELPEVSMVSATATKNAFSNNLYLHSIDKIIVSEKTVFINSFENIFSKR